MKNFEDVVKQVEHLQLIDVRKKPTQEHIEMCASTTNLTVSDRSKDDYYCLLRDCQGDLNKYLEIGLMPDDSEFIKDSLFCEYAYIINLDNKTIEFYCGFKTKPHNKGRYASAVPNEDGYYPCALVKTYKRIPSDWLEKINKIMD